MSILGSCAGQNGDAFECGGTGNFIKWSVDLGADDFVVESVFMASEVAGTALSFVFWSGGTKKKVVLDGGGDTFRTVDILSSGSTGHGSSTLVASKYHTITLIRRDGLLAVFLDGVQLDSGPLPMADDIDAVGLGMGDGRLPFRRSCAHVWLPEAELLSRSNAVALLSALAHARPHTTVA